MGPLWPPEFLWKQLVPAVHLSHPFLLWPCADVKSQAEPLCRGGLRFPELTGAFPGGRAGVPKDCRQTAKHLLRHQRANSAIVKARALSHHIFSFVSEGTSLEKVTETLLVCVLGQPPVPRSPPRAS